MENSVADPQKIKITIWFSNSTCENISRGNENTNLKRYLQSYVHNSIVYNSQGMETTEMFIDKWMAGEDVICMYTVEYTSVVKKRNPAICTVDGHWGHCAEWINQIKTDFVWSPFCVESEKQNSREIGFMV